MGRRLQAPAHEAREQRLSLGEPGRVQHVAVAGSVPGERDETGGPKRAQIPYSLSAREPERELLPMAAALGLAVTPWGVLEAGALTGKPAAERRWPDSGNSPAAERVVAALRKVAGGVGASPAQVAIAWLLHRDEPPPIVGARRAEQIVAGLDALELVLDPAQLEELEAAGLPQLGFPRSFLESEEVRELIYGTTFAQLVP